MNKFKGISTAELRAEVNRRDERNQKRAMKRWRDQNRCRRDDCNESIRQLQSEVVDEVTYGDGLMEKLAAIEYEITETCDAGHITSHRETIRTEPERKKEVSITMTGKPYEGPIVVRYWRHSVEHSSEEAEFVEAWEDWNRISEAGEIYLFSFEKPDGTVLWEMPNPFDGWIRRSPDAPPLPEPKDG